MPTIQPKERTAARPSSASGTVSADSGRPSRNLTTIGLCGARGAVGLRVALADHGGVRSAALARPAAPMYAPREDRVDASRDLESPHGPRQPIGSPRAGEYAGLEQ